LFVCFCLALGALVSRAKEKIREFGKISEAILTLESYLEVKKLEAKK
jgi:hypothetical protein